jgi:alpha-tubulin suppressor-like RCC1 family protein
LTDANVAQISAGINGHTCALTTAGKAYCWGAGSFGQLGNGGITNQLTPVAVDMPTE